MFHYDTWDVTHTIKLWRLFVLFSINTMTIKTNNINVFKKMNKQKLQKTILLACLLIIFNAITSCHNGGSPDEANINLVPDISVDANIIQILLDETNNYLYAIDNFENIIYVVDTQANIVATKIEIPQTSPDILRPTTIAAANNNEKNTSFLFVALQSDNPSNDQDNKILVFNLTDITSDNLELSQINLANGNATSLAIDNNSKTLYVGYQDDSNPAANEIRAYDLSSLFDSDSPQTPVNYIALKDESGIPVNHAHIIGFDQQARLLLSTNLYNGNPNVTCWHNPESNIPIMGNAHQFFDGVVQEHGRIAFNKNRSRSTPILGFVLTDAPASYEGELPSYTFKIRENDQICEITNDTNNYSIDFRPVAIAVNSNADRLVVAHNTAIFSEPPDRKHTDTHHDLHVYIFSEGKYILSEIKVLAELGIAPNLSIQERGLIIDSNDRLYMLLGDPSDGKTPSTQPIKGKLIAILDY